MKPPMVYEVTIPSSQRMSRITKSVQSIVFFLSSIEETSDKRRALLWPSSKTKQDIGRRGVWRGALR